MKPDSFAEKTARDRVCSLLDAGTFRELLDPFARLESPHLPVQEIVPQSDDGVVIARGKLGDKNALVLSLEGGFQGQAARLQRQRYPGADCLGAAC